MAAAALQAAAELTSAYESAHEALERGKAFPSIDRRVGDGLRARNVKIGELVNGWDDNGGGDGTVDMAEFVSHVRRLGVMGGDDELEDLFRRVDKSGNGGLDVADATAHTVPSD
jgi:hypothetical protein